MRLLPIIGQIKRSVAFIIARLGGFDVLCLKAIFNIPRGGLRDTQRLISQY